MPLSTHNLAVRLRLAAQRTDDNLTKIQVTDTGIGIVPQYQDLIFERLYRVDASRSNVEGLASGFLSPER
ncbi:ATP-binding protein [Vibrio ostreae]|uniref:ATP-binding protein n=1 Tax=Vibrio ostreae TaxID=2841925 RepID=A0A975U621_9VIBR|nr:ATP-binding protein [Vibrio ostreae]QXO15849.1 ATP-binding protein [Vibrio ostreae]